MAEQISRYFGDKIVGQERIRSLLGESFRNGRTAHAYLFSGHRGIGKAAVALEFATLLLCENPAEKSCGECFQCQLSRQLQHPDLHLVFPIPPPKTSEEDDDDVEDFKAEILEAMSKQTKEMAENAYAAARLQLKKKADDKSGKTPSDRIIVAQIRSLLRSLSRKPMQASRKVSVIFHADTMNVVAQNVLLKGLEEPPDGGYFLLITENEKMLLPTIRSRCQKLSILPLSKEEITQNLITQGVERTQAESISILSEGSMIKARELLTPELEKLQGLVFDFLAECFRCNPISLPKAVEEITDLDKLPPNTGLKLLATLLKDLAVAKVNFADQKEKLSFARFNSRIEKFLTACPEANFELAVNAVEEAIYQLEKGYTKSLALMGMAIKIQAALKQNSFSAVKTYTEHYA